MTEKFQGVLTGKVAIITGAGSGIGAAAATAMAAAGAAVVVADCRADSASKVVEAITAVGGRAVAAHVDVGSEPEVAAMVDTAMDAFGALNILHNNAAAQELTLRDGAIHELELEVWNRTLNVNATGVMLGCKHAIPHMIAAGGGSIINTASGNGHVAESTRSAYSASKGAIIAFTRSVATQYGRNGIRCNAVSPGIVLSEIVRDLVPQQMKDTWLRHTLTPRLGVPDDIAATVVFLASDAAAYLTGQTIVVDGGQTVHQPWWADDRVE